MPSVIKSIMPGSPALKTRLRPGDKLLSIDGNPIKDVLDYKFYSYDQRLVLEAKSPEGKLKRVTVRKDEGQELGLEFETYLMDKARSCANKCVFCFVDQLPEGMRETLYFKDDDARLSFLMGNYITLTNLSEREIRRIIDLRVSPINISVHSMNPQLRCQLLGNCKADAGLTTMHRLAGAGIIMNCQIVCCPGLNDGDELSRSMEELAEMYPGVNSVSIVPVGLTKYRDGLPELTPFDSALALKTVRQVEAYSSECHERHGSRIFFCADELYLKAGLPIPSDEFYEDYAQLENGVGMLRLLITEFDSALEVLECAASQPFSVACGVSAAPFIEKLVYEAHQKCDTIDGRVYPIVNEFFGTSIDVSGLVTGGDILKQLTGRELGSHLLIPQTMLRHGEGVFLDDVTVSQVSEKLGVPVYPIEQDGGKLAEAFFGIIRNIISE